MDFSNSSNFIPKQNHYHYSTLVYNSSPLIPSSFPSPISTPFDPMSQTQPPLPPNVLDEELTYPPNYISLMDSSQLLESPNLSHLSSFQTNGLTLEQYNSVLNLNPSNEIIFSDVNVIDNTYDVFINDDNQNVIENPSMMEATKSLRRTRNGKWDEGEDRQLKTLMENTRGRQKWSEVSEKMGNRSGKQCRERWLNHIQPDIKKDRVWSVEEEVVIVQVHKKYGNRWSFIAQKLPGRTECSVKNHWNATKRKLLTSNKLKLPHSLLSQYILGLLTNA